MASDLTDLVRRLRSLVTPSSIGNEAADAISSLIELERRVKRAPVMRVYNGGGLDADAFTTLREFRGKRVRLLVVEE